MSEAMAMPKLSVGMSVYKWLVELYPESYRHEYGGQMMLVMEDLCREELARTGAVGAGFWLWQIMDVSQGVVKQHIYLMGGVGMKKYLMEEFGLSWFHMAGIMLLLPFLLVLTLDFSSRVVQGNLGHPNTGMLQVLNRTWLYSPQVLFVWIVLFPLMAALLALVPVIRRAKKEKVSWLNLNFLKLNLVSVVIILVGLGCVALVKFHDFAPCMAHGVLSHGFANFPNIFSVCRKA